MNLRRYFSIQLRFQLLEKVLLRLGPFERLSCAVTCRHWRPIISKSELLEDVREVILESQVAESVKVLLRTDRIYRGLKIAAGNDTSLWKYPVEVEESSLSSPLTAGAGFLDASHQGRIMVKHIPGSCPFV